MELDKDFFYLALAHKDLEGCKKAELTYTWNTIRKQTATRVISWLVQPLTFSLNLLRELHQKR